MRVRTKAAFFSAMFLAACHPASPPAPHAPAAVTKEAQADPAFVGKVWISTTPGQPQGTIVVFLPDRSLLMTSCAETYRLSKWDITGAILRWIEDTIPIQATVSMPHPNELSLEIAGQDRVQSYRLARAPYICPGG